MTKKLSDRLRGIRDILTDECGHIEEWRPADIAIADLADKAADALDAAYAKHDIDKITMENFLRQLGALERQLAMKQDDWLDVCKEVDAKDAEIERLNGNIKISGGLKCPDCDDTGCYPQQIDFDEWEPMQCEFCYTIDDSIFNRKAKLDKAND